MLGEKSALNNKHQTNINKCGFQDLNRLSFISPSKWSFKSYYVIAENTGMRNLSLGEIEMFPNGNIDLWLNGCFRLQCSILIEKSMGTESQ